MNSIILKHTGFKLSSDFQDDLDDAQFVEDVIVKQLKNIKYANDTPVEQEYLDSITKYPYIAFIQTFTGMYDTFIIGTDTLDELKDNIIQELQDSGEPDQIEIIPFHNGQKISVKVQIEYEY